MKFIEGKSIRFLAAGGANTVVTYLAYLVLLPLVGYRGAFSTAFIGGVVLGYAMNARLVFRQSFRRRTFLEYGLVYVAQYLVGLGLLTAFVDGLKVPARLAPALCLPITVLLTYLLSNKIFRAGRVF